ncbi:MAG TPA: PLDc N-terminal domain-containing protein [Sphingobacteriaceae bacterium]
MTKKRILRLGFLIIVVGVVLRVLHVGGTLASITVWLSVIVTLAYVIIAVFEVNNSDRITSKEKVMWTLALLFFNALAGLIYFLIARPRILGLNRTKFKER